MFLAPDRGSFDRLQLALPKSGDIPEYAVNKQSASPSHYSSLSQLSPYSTHVSRGPVKKDGTPDMRYAVNRFAYSSSDTSYSSRSSSRSYGPLKSDGTPDMRYAANRSAYSSSDTNYSSRSPSSSRGPLKQDGTPDMRFKANRR